MAAQTAIKIAGDLVADDDRAVIAFRVDRMRAWRERRPQSVADEHLRHHPYVAAALALEERIGDPGAKTTRFEIATPGLLMLLPALRSQGLLEVS